MDSTGSKRQSLGGNKYAHVKMCHGSRMIFVSFHKKKSEFEQDAYDFIKWVRRKKHKTLKTIRCDRTPEYVSLKDKINKSHPGISFEFTPRDTPEYNGKIERAIATI